MNESKAGDGDVSSLLNNIYRCADKSSWYSNVVDAYDRTRPRYPVELLHRVKEMTQLQPGKKVLEIGAGVGIATVELAKLGLEMVTVEPSLSACELAQHKCSDYARVEFVNSTFEDYEPTGDKFDAIVAATSFHWVTPKIRTQKTASLLKDNGYLVLLWNTPPQPILEVLHELKPVYQAYAPELTSSEDIQTHQQNLTEFGQEILDSGYYQDLISAHTVCEIDYTVDKYLTLLTTLSPYIRLPPSQRDTLLVELKKVLKLKYGDRLKLSYLSMFQIAQKAFN